jgi:hypothetical protein
VQFNSTGGIFLRLDSSGNLNIYDTTGTTIAKFIGSAFSTKINKGTPGNNVPIGSTTSLGVHVGYYSQITPQASGAVLAFVEAYCSNNTASDGVQVAIYYKSGAQTPAGGASIAGWTLASTVSSNVVPVGMSLPFPVTALVDGLTVGTVYTFAVVFGAVTGGTATIAIGASDTSKVIPTFEV